jgi:hypothetical protein
MQLPADAEAAIRRMQNANLKLAQTMFLQLPNNYSAEQVGESMCGLAHTVRLTARLVTCSF